MRWLVVGLVATMIGCSGEPEKIEAPDTLEASDTNEAQDTLTPSAKWLEDFIDRAYHKTHENPETVTSLDSFDFFPGESSTKPLAGELRLSRVEGGDAEPDAKWVIMRWTISYEFHEGEGWKSPGVVETRESIAGGSSPTLLDPQQVQAHPILQHFVP